MSRKRRRHDRRFPSTAPGAAPGHDAAAAAGSAHEAATTDARVREADPELPLDAATSIGMRLRAARNAAGLSLEDVARSSRIGVSILGAIESDDLAMLGAPIYARGYLKAYARVVGLPEAAVADALESREAAAPALVATQRTSRTHYLASRYAPPLAYALLTLVVLVPLVMSLRPALTPAPLAGPALQPIDGSSAELGVPAERSALPPPAVDPLTTAAAAASVATGPEPAPQPAEPAPVEPAAAAAQQPVMASMTAMPDAAAPALPASRHVVLRLSQQSWVELTGATGQRIEYGLLPGGTVREYQISGDASLRIGNVRGATLQIDGQPVDLQSYTSGNVARVRVGGDIAAR